jgi:hypothetical protein
MPRIMNPALAYIETLFVLMVMIQTTTRSDGKIAITAMVYVATSRVLPLLLPRLCSKQGWHPSKSFFPATTNFESLKPRPAFDSNPSPLLKAPFYRRSKQASLHALKSYLILLFLFSTLSSFAGSLSMFPPAESFELAKQAS